MKALRIRQVGLVLTVSALALVQGVWFHVTPPDNIGTPLVGTMITGSLLLMFWVWRAK